jgi:hypothetical protein
MNINFGLYIHIDFKASSIEEYGADGRMMTDLLSVYWTAIDDALKGLS